MKRGLIVVVALAAAACASSGSSTEGSTKARSDRSVLTIEEISKTGVQDAFTAVQSLRPHWLNKRGVTSIRQSETIKVYIDGNLMGGPDHLRQITTSSIASIRHMDALEATQRYGLDHGVGAILVFTRRYER